MSWTISEAHMQADRHAAQQQELNYLQRTHGINWGGRYDVHEVAEWGGIGDQYPYQSVDRYLTTDDLKAARRYAAILNSNGGIDEGEDLRASATGQFGVWIYNPLTGRENPAFTKENPC